MPASYQIEFKDLVQVLLPPTKRTAVHIAWLKALIGSQMDYLNNLTYNWYDEGITASQYDATGSVYFKGTPVLGTAEQGYPVYICLANGVSGPFDPTKWLLLMPSSLGYSDRNGYRANRMQLEYALNRTFSVVYGTLYKQPNEFDTIRSDIYILDNALFTETVFEVGPDDTHSSFVDSDFFSGPWVGPDPTVYPSGPTTAFTIYYPSYMIDPTTGSLMAPSVIHDVAAKWVDASMPFNCVAY